MAGQLQQTPNVNQNIGNVEVKGKNKVFLGIVHGDVHMNSLERQSQSLDTAIEASHDAASKEQLPSCLENTRVDVLSRIQGWIDGDGERRLYWLKGMAGTGKSTIALTIARNYAMHKRPGASFFFSRGGGDLASANKFVVTIAAQLSRTLPGFQKHLDHALATNRDVLNKGIYNQWETLVLEPLKQLSNDGFRCPIAIIVDALDECENDRHVADLIECFQEAAAIEHAPVRIFVTSRPESAINHEFTTVPRDMRQDLVLHDIEDSIVNRDLHLFYQYRLKNIARRFHLGDAVYSDHTVETLVESSHCLFIYAATVCRFIEELEEDAHDRLSLILDSKNLSPRPTKRLDDMYTKVLEHSWPRSAELTPEEKTKRKRRFSRIVGSIVMLCDVLSTVDLASILSTSVDEVRWALQSLHSVLDVPEDESKPIRLLHPSFRDFLLDPVRCQTEMFSIDDKEIHGRLFHDCLLLMKNHLKRNMCKLDHPGIRAYDMHKADVDSFIPRSVQYACRYWLYHLQQNGFKFSADACLGLEEFFNTSFLYWLETLSVLRRFSEAVAMIRLLDTRLSPSPSSRFSSSSTSWLPKTKTKMKAQEKDKEKNASHTPSLQETVHDAARFAMANAAIIEEAPLQIYCSALVFSPEKSIIRRLYSRRIPSWVLLHPVVRRDWTPYSRTLVNPERVNSIAFSPDAQLLASGSCDNTIQLWNAATGRKVRSMEGHVSSPFGAEECSHPFFLVPAKRGINLTVAFSPNSRLLASGSKDGTIQVWDAMTGKEQCTVEGHSGDLKTIVFSPDNSLLASGSSDGTVHILDASTGEEQRATKDTRHDWVRAVALRQDSHLALSTENNELGIDQLRDHSLPNLWQPGRPKNWKIAMAFSPDLRLAAADKRIRRNMGILQLWDIASGRKAQSLRYHFKSSVTAVAFSTDGKLVAAAFQDTTIRLWNTATGKNMSTFHTCEYENLRRFATQMSVDFGRSRLISCLAFSPDGQLASASENGEIRLWDTTTSTQVPPAVERKPSRLDVEYGTSVWVQWNENSVKLWDAATNKERCTLRIPRGFGSVHHTKFSPDDRWVAVQLEGGIVLYAVTTGRKSCVIGKPSLFVELAGTLDKYWDLGRFFNFSADGQYLAVAYPDTIDTWDIENGQKQHEFEHIGHSRTLGPPFAISPNGKWVAVMEDEGLVFWNAATREKVRTLAPGSIPGSGNAVAFSPNGNLIAAGFGQNIVTWNPTTGEKQHILTSEVDSFRDQHKMEFSPDGRLVVSSYLAKDEGDSSCVIWDLDSGQTVYRLQDSKAFAISPDSHFVVFSTSHAIQLWERATGRELCLDSNVPRCRQIYIPPCGRHIVTEQGEFRLPSAAPQPPHYLSANPLWIREDGNDLIHIHTDYRGDYAFVAGNCVLFSNAPDSILQIDRLSDFKID